MPSKKFLFALVFASFFASACSHRQHVAQIPPPPPPTTAQPPSPPPAERSPARQPEERENNAPKALASYTEVGYASWYGDPYHGRRAANGEIYNKYKLTAAHLTLPMGAEVKVTNLENNLSVNVRINDRGPFAKSRIVDLSLAAAQKIQMTGPGTALVRLEVLSLPSEPDMGSFLVQAGAFGERQSAEKLRDRLKPRYGDPIIEKAETDQGIVYRVRLGPKSSLLQSRQLASELRSEMLDAYVVRVDK